MSAERPAWSELEQMLDRIEKSPDRKLRIEELQRFHYLYERTAADLGRVNTFASEPGMRRYLEQLVARAYGEIHETRSRHVRFKPWRWFFETLPQTFRRRVAAFWLALAITIAGSIFGGVATIADPESRSVTMPFGHDVLDPLERVAKEETSPYDRLKGHQTSFAAFLMTNNIKVSLLTLALGMTWGIGTIIVLFKNMVGLGAIVVDYVTAGQTEFLLGWLMPHGVIEIPAILIAAQAGFVLAGALLGRGQHAQLGARMRAVAPDVVTLAGGVAVMLVWAGIVEGFFSQYHEPVIPYLAKIAFGAVELVLLVLYLSRCGSKADESLMTTTNANDQPAYFT
ncbi:MAG: stage II sporulation protein M [Verrucomicrobia subdivision 3 bacterium]|nr:stage II sporulation protein M [Limisphaerales bacterium]